MPSAGRYSLNRKIAGGGMAEIYLGTQRGAVGFERPVVIKAILGAHSNDPHFRNMLIDEAHIAMSLTHSNIVQVLDLGVAGGRYFLILELVDGWDLDQLLRRAEAAQWPLPAPLALHITIEVCRALAYAHAKSRDGKTLGIIHRDVSPHNVLVSEHGEVKLTDFGIALAADRKERTVVGFVKGKIGFMSPEQAAGGTLDARSDLFALGTVLYLLVTGQRPFAADSELESLLRTKEVRFTPPEAARPGLAPELARVIERAMRGDPAERFADAESMLVALEQVARTALDPAGPTELKRWLAELSARDGERPASQQTIPPQEVADDAILSVQAESPAAPESAAPRIPPPPPPSARLPTSGGRGAGWTIAAAGASALITAGVLRASGGGATSARPREEPAEARSVGARPLPGGEVASAQSALPKSLSNSLPLSGTLPNEPRAATADAGRGPLAALSVDAGELADHPPAHREEARSVSPDPALTSVSDLSQSVSVRLTSNPPGAEVRIERKPFGVTPASIRFRPGVVYQVRFDLPGYQPIERHVYVSQRKDQTLDVVLRKMP